MQKWLSIPLLVCCALLVGCSTVYYSVWETLGKEKRDLLRDNVEAVQEDQEEVSEQFASTVERIRELYGLDGGDLEKQYNRLNGSFEESVERSDTLKERIRTVDEIANDLFKEWEEELQEISDANLRQRSNRQLADTRSRYHQLAATLSKTEAGLDPVLQKFKDQVLYLKHNLNAQAIGSLEAEGTSIQRDVDALIQDLKKSIRQADAFIQGLPQ